MTSQQTKSPYKRWRIFVDRPIQGALLLRVVMYCAVCLLIQQLIVFLYVIVTSPLDNVHANTARVLWHIELSALASLVVLPIILLDVLRLSHRWVGPVFRLRATLHSLTVGEPVPPIRFRDGDFWQDLARDINVLTAELNRFRSDKPQDYIATEPLPSPNTNNSSPASSPAPSPAPASFFSPLASSATAPAAPPSVPITAG